MSKYAKAQEYRFRLRCQENPMVDVIKYYGSREKMAGDFLLKIGKHQVRVDHKSTISDSKIRIQKDWLVKLSGICLVRMDAEGACIPAISISFKGCNKMFAMTTRRLISLPVKATVPWIKAMPNKKSVSVACGTLRDLGDNVSVVTFSGQCVYIMDWDVFVKGVYDV